MAQSDYVRSLDNHEKLSYFHKLKQLGFVREEDDPFIEEDNPSKGHLKKWSTSIDSWPTVEFGDIYVYLIDNPGYTSKSLKAYKSLEAYDAFAKGWVHQLNIRQSHTGHCIIRASVNRTQNISDGRHIAWVGFKLEDGSIISGHCTCMNSSTAICFHAVAIMFQVEAAPRLNDKRKICTVCRCIDEKVPESQETVSSLSGEDVSLSVIKVLKSDDVTSQEEFDHNISMLPQTSDNIVKSETNCVETDSKELTYIQCEGVEPGMIIILASEDPDGQGIISQQLNEIHSCKDCNLSFATRLLLESHMETHHQPMEVKPMPGAKIVSNVAHQESATESDKTKKASPVKTRSQKGKHQCDMCDSVFTTSRGLENHKKQQHKNGHPKIMEEGEDTAEIATGSTSKEEPTGGSRDNIYSCATCSMTFTTSFLLKSHMGKEHNAAVMELAEAELVTEKKPSRQITADTETKSKFISKEMSLKCQGCGKVFKHSSHFFIHLEMHSRKDKSFQVICHQCGKVYTVISDFKRHLKEHSAKKHFPFSCHVCGKKCTSRSVLQRHVSTHPKQQLYQCNECGKCYIHHGSYHHHMQMHADAKSFLCEMCGKSFSHSRLLMGHMATHKEEKVAKCKECGKTFSQRSNLMRHMRTHTGEKPFACEECGRRFTQNANLIAHKNNLHIHKKTDSEPYACNLCNRTFSYPGYLKIHIKSHTHRLPIPRHIRNVSHPVERPYLCNSCGKSFASSHYRDAHQKIHTGETPNKCSKCPKCFATKVAVIAHERTHTGERPFICPVCKRGFSLSGNLGRHMRLHSGEKPYGCKDCDKTFTSLDSLTVHRRIHTGEKPYKCDLCVQSFCENRGLKKHKQKFHNNGE